jgi:flavin reductase (DIM6/NTAB) family NADH-FMN oxidoreductase RutF
VEVEDVVRQAVEGLDVHVVVEPVDDGRGPVLDHDPPPALEGHRPVAVVAAAGHVERRRDEVAPLAEPHAEEVGHRHLDRRLGLVVPVGADDELPLDGGVVPRRDRQPPSPHDAGAAVVHEGEGVAGREAAEVVVPLPRVVARVVRDPALARADERVERADARELGRGGRRLEERPRRQGVGESRAGDAHDRVRCDGCDAPAPACRMARRRRKMPEGGAPASATLRVIPKPTRTETMNEVAALFHRLTLGVYVVGVADGARRNAFTAAWVMQASFEPLLLALSINPQNASAPLLRAGGTFAVSVLKDGQLALARRFGTRSGRDEDKLAGVRWRPGRGGAPILEEALAYFDCEVVERLQVGDHELVVGRVVDGGILARDAAPLPYAATGEMDGSSALYPPQL